MYKLKNTNERLNVLLWLITGIGKHGLHIKDANKLTWDYITTNYNVDNFICNHLVVSEIGYVESADGKGYDGFCECCNKTVRGFVPNKGSECKKEKWS